MTWKTYLVVQTDTYFYVMYHGQSSKIHDRLESRVSKVQDLNLRIKSLKTTVILDQVERVFTQILVQCKIHMCQKVDLKILTQHSFIFLFIYLYIHTFTGDVIINLIAFLQFCWFTYGFSPICLIPFGSVELRKFFLVSLGIYSSFILMVHILLR